MELLLLVTHPEAGSIVRGMAEASHRAGIEWGAFLTNEGVKLLQDGAVVAALQQAACALVCQDSWNRHMSGQPCPLELNSQTGNSALVARAAHLVSL